MSSENYFETVNVFTIHCFGITIPISSTIVMMWIIMAIIVILALVFTRNFKTVPTGKQNVTEIMVETIGKILQGNMGEHGKHFVPYFGTILIFLVFSNISGIFNIFPTGEQLYNLTGLEFFKHFITIQPPTKDLNLTLAMALMTVCLIPISAIRFKGVTGWLKTFVHPTPVMLPFNILDYATRTLSLSLRLFGNILAGFIIMEMLFSGAIFVKPIIPLASAFFDLFDAGLQAYIFVFLSSIYISEAIE